MSIASGSMPGHRHVVRMASRHAAEFGLEEREVNGKEYHGLMMLAAGQGSKLRIRCEGRMPKKRWRSWRN